MRTVSAAAALLAVHVASAAGELRHVAGPLRIVPESERSLDFVIAGTNGPSGPYFLLPELGPMKGLSAELKRELGAELFALDVELSHGAFFRRLPVETELIVAVPDSGAPGPTAESLFRRYLKEHAGWTAADTAKRVRFLPVPSPVVYTRDGGKVVTRDARGRVVIATGLVDRPVYQDFAALLAEKLPDRFTLLKLESDVSSEGGDLTFARLPGGKMALFLGHHRFLRYFDRDEKETKSGLTDDEIRRVEEAYAKSIPGVSVIPVPASAVKDPTSVVPELFHLDMLVAFLSRPEGADAFVPSIVAKPVDRTSGAPVPPELRDAAQAAYDHVATELEAHGLKVSRIPFNDHPARGPANIVGFVDRAGRPSVLLAKYPSQLPTADGSAPQEQFRRALKALKDEVAYLTQSGRKGLEPRWREAFHTAWKDLERIEALPSPEWEEKKRIFEARGFRVVEVPLFAWGGGGLHCLALR